MCTCELEIVCTFECVVCNILWILDIFGRLWFINVVCDMLKSICGLHKYMLCLSHVKAKRKEKKRRRRGLPRVHGQLHSGKTFIKNGDLALGTRHSGKGLKKQIFKKRNFFPECCTRGRVKNRETVSTALNRPQELGWHLGKASPSARISSPSVALG
jgi:hypothetical protein